MQTVLAQLNTVPGVVGSLLCGADGALLAEAFPPVFDRAVLAEVSKTVADTATGLATVTGPVNLVDLRYPSARIVVKPMAGAHLLFLCSAAANVQTLAISVSVAAPRLEKLVAERGQAAGAARPPQGQLHAAVQRIEETIRRRGLDPFEVRGEIALKAGFGLGFIDEETPDDAEQLAKLKAAAAAVLGERI
jgi:predicted regulator of Ras-like GTPase activity (Roadblock/LC7/MglB family)